MGELLGAPQPPTAVLALTAAAVACGMALGAILNRRDRRFFCLTSDGELDGAIKAWDRVEAHAAARKHAAVAEFIRRLRDELAGSQRRRGARR